MLVVSVVSIVSVLSVVAVEEAAGGDSGGVTIGPVTKVVGSSLSKDSVVDDCDMPGGHNSVSPVHSDEVLVNTGMPSSDEVILVNIGVSTLDDEGGMGKEDTVTLVKNGSSDSEAGFIS